MRPVGVVTATALLLALLAWSAAPARAGHGNLVMALDPDYVQAQYEKGRKLTAIDLRSVKEFRQGHLPGARSLPFDQLTARFAEVPRTDLVILYCDCKPYDIADRAVFLEYRGYRNIFIMPEGYSGWVKRGYPIETSRR